MKKVLRIIRLDEKTKWIDLPETFAYIPRKGDSIVLNQKIYIVMYVEYDFDNQTVIETTRVEIYHNNELVKSSYDSQIVIQYPIDGDTYIYKVIMENPDRIIYTEELIYTNPYLQDEINILLEDMLK